MGTEPQQSRIRSYRDLIAWRRAFDLGLAILRATSSFPVSERMGLTLQLRRAAVSIAANIAEGYGRGARREYIRYLKIARGSLFELETHILFCKELDLLTPDLHADLSQQLNDTARVLSGLIRSLEQRGDLGAA